MSEKRGKGKVRLGLAGEEVMAGLRSGCRTIGELSRILDSISSKGEGATEDKKSTLAPHWSPLFVISDVDL